MGRKGDVTPDYQYIISEQYIVPAALFGEK